MDNPCRQISVNSWTKMHAFRRAHFYLCSSLKSVGRNRYELRAAGCGVAFGLRLRQNFTPICVFCVIHGEPIPEIPTFVSEPNMQKPWAIRP